MKGHVRKRGTWEFIVDIGPDPTTGRRRQRSRSGFVTRREAERALHAFVHRLDSGGDAAPQRILLHAYLSRWLEYQRARGLRSSTLEGYEGYIRREIVPLLGGVEVAKIGPPHVRALLTRMQDHGLSPTTIAQVRGILGSALRQAVHDGLVPTSPVSAVKRPRTRRPDLHWPTPQELVRLLGACRGTLWEIPIVLASVTGARRSEILAMSWDQVNLQTGTIWIRRNVRCVRRAEAPEGVAFIPLKTSRSQRVVQLPPFALARVRRHRREQLERRAALGSAWRDPLDGAGHPVPLICDRGDGFLIHPDSFTHGFKRLALKAGLHPATRLHDVRHAVATELGRRGVHPVIVSAVLGHASPAFTVAVYQHAWQEGPSEAAAAMEAALRPPDVGNPLANRPLDTEREADPIAK